MKKRALKISEIPGLAIGPLPVDQTVLDSLGGVLGDEAASRTKLSHFSLGTLAAHPYKQKKGSRRSDYAVCGLPGQFWCWIEANHFELGIVWFLVHMRLHYELEEAGIIFPSQAQEKSVSAFLFFRGCGERSYRLNSVASKPGVDLCELTPSGDVRCRLARAERIQIMDALARDAAALN